ncbi:hypothetical protein KBC70_03025 [Candidatus Woesebacteria bacterium]|nr:hypothetical protein [Candidatus Woesebacteria bacterium]
MTKWVIKHYNVITVFLGVVSLYLFVQDFQHDMTLYYPYPRVLGWFFANMWANYFLATQTAKVNWDANPSAENVNQDEYQSVKTMLTTKIRILKVAFVYAIGLMFFLVFGLYQGL